MNEEKKKHRLLTRSDFDGLVCAILLMHLEIINDVDFVHPKDMQDGKIQVSNNDVSTNLPYVEGIHLAFDHHMSEIIRVQGQSDNHIIDPTAPSTARVVYNYYGGQEKFSSSSITEEMLNAVDKCDSARFSLDEILEPTGWVFLNFIMDPRTGLGRFKDYKHSSYKLMVDMIIKSGANAIDELLQLPDMVEQIEYYNNHKKKAREQIRNCSQLHDNLVVLDLRNQKTIFITNRFTIYALYPQCNASIHIMWGKEKKNIVFAVGKSVIKRDNEANIGEIMLKYGGGGHPNTGTCQVANDQVDQVLHELIEHLTK